MMKAKEIFSKSLASVIGGVTAAFVVYLFTKDIGQFRFLAVSNPISFFIISLCEGWYKNRKKKG